MQTLLTWRGSIVSAAKSVTFASLTSLCELKTHWTKRLGWQLWFINLAKLPIELASMQYSGAGGASESFSGWRLGRCISDPALFCRTEYIAWVFKNKCSKSIWWNFSTPKICITARTSDIGVEFGNISCYSKWENYYLPSIQTLHGLKTVDVKTIVVLWTIQIFGPPQHPRVLTDGSPREDSVPSPDSPTFWSCLKYLQNSVC